MTTDEVRQPGTEIASDSVFQAYSGTDFNLAVIAALPEERPSYFPVFTTAIFFVAALLVFMSFFAEQPSILQVVAVGLVCVFSIPAYLFDSKLERKEVQQIIQPCEGVVRDLRQLHTWFKQYLCDMDSRAAKFFSSVTSSKIRTYFLVRQLETALGMTVNRLEELVTKTDSKSYRELRELLLSALEYRDGLEFSTGALHKTPLSEVVATVIELVDTLEKGFKRLEKEIAVAASVSKGGKV